MTNEEFQLLAQRELTEILDTLKRKNADYTAGSSDPFANFKVTETLGLAGAETGVLIRMVDKIQRVKSFLAKGNLQVNESVQDSLRDIIGYSIVLMGLLEDRPKPATVAQLGEAWQTFTPSKSVKEISEERKARIREDARQDVTKARSTDELEQFDTHCKPSGAI